MNHTPLHWCKEKSCTVTQKDQTISGQKSTVPLCSLALFRGKWTCQSVSSLHRHWSHLNKQSALGINLVWQPADHIWHLNLDHQQMCMCPTRCPPLTLTQKEIHVRNIGSVMTAKTVTLSVLRWFYRILTLYIVIPGHKWMCWYKDSTCVHVQYPVQAHHLWWSSEFRNHTFTFIPLISLKSASPQLHQYFCLQLVGSGIRASVKTLFRSFVVSLFSIYNPLRLNWQHKAAPARTLNCFYILKNNDHRKILLTNAAQDYTILL